MGAYGPPPGFYKNSPRVRVDEKYCTGCMNCVKRCPSKGALIPTRVNGALKVRAGEPGACVGCGRCVMACRTLAVGIYLE